MSVLRVPFLRAFEVFRIPGYRLLWPANFLAYTARWMQVTLLGWLVLELTNSAFRVALLGASGMLPLLCFGLVGGVLADRVNKQQLLIVTQTLSCGASVFMVCMLIADVVCFWHAYLAIGVTGIGWALDMPSRRSLVHDLVGGPKLTNAIAMDSVGMQASRMIGPGLAGALITMTDVLGGYAVVSMVYIVGLALIAVARIPAASRSPKEKDQTPVDLLAAMRHVTSDKVLLATVFVTILMNLLLFPHVELLPVIARDVLQIGPGRMGTLLAIEGLGALFGAISIASMGAIRYHGRFYTVGSMLALIMLFCFSMCQGYLVTLVILFLLGFATSGFATMQSTLVLLRTDQALRGRALGVISLAIGAGPLGAMMIGILAEKRSVTFALEVHSLLGILSLSLIGFLMPRLWRHPTVLR